jgi:hypothetical protein
VLGCRKANNTTAEIATVIVDALFVVILMLREESKHSAEEPKDLLFPGGLPLNDDEEEPSRRADVAVQVGDQASRGSCQVLGRADLGDP